MVCTKHWKYPAEDDLVVAALRGVVAANPTLQLIAAEKVVFRPPNKKVSVISGGGAGHEPLHAGFVGTNLLDAAVSGSVFASPSTKQIMAAVHATRSDCGTLIVVKNYTGDILHFALAAERAKRDGIDVELVVVSDDVAVGRTQNEMVGRRGLAGTAVMHKVVGAAAAAGHSLQELATLGRSVNALMATMSASLTRASVPGRAPEGNPDIDAHTAELGLGIHNEPGEVIPLPDVEQLVDTLYLRLLDSADSERHYLDINPDDDYIVVVNNLGGTSSLELYALTHYVLARCPLKKRPLRVLVSDFVTSLNAHGFSVTLLNVTALAASVFSAQDVLKFLDVETDASGWKPNTYTPQAWAKLAPEVDSEQRHLRMPSSAHRIDTRKFSDGLTFGCRRLIEQEPLITKYDTLVGDGDCGETLKRGAEGILDSLTNDNSFTRHLADPVAGLCAITEIVEDCMGGTSGGLYAIYLTALCKELQTASEMSTQAVAGAMHRALYDGLFKYTKARQGGRTLVDALQPFVDTLHKTGNLQQLVDSARDGSVGTAKLAAKFGRASYVSESILAADGGVPDPGAVGLVALLEGFAAGFTYLLRSTV